MWWEGSGGVRAEEKRILVGRDEQSSLSLAVVTGLNSYLAATSQHSQHSQLFPGRAALHRRCDWPEIASLVLGLGNQVPEIGCSLQCVWGMASLELALIRRSYSLATAIQCTPNHLVLFSLCLTCQHHAHRRDHSSNFSSPFRTLLGRY